MTEIWLRPNIRALCFAAVLPVGMLVIGLLLAFDVFSLEQGMWLTALGYAIAAVAIYLLGLIAWQARQPRLARRDDALLVYLRQGSPIAVPLEIVECFLLGHAPTLIGGRRHARMETSAVIIRLAESAVDWAQRDVKPALGNWCGGMITVRGTWCEPLSVDLVMKLNARLAEARQAGVVS